MEDLYGGHRDKQGERSRLVTQIAGENLCNLESWSCLVSNYKTQQLYNARKPLHRHFSRKDPLRLPNEIVMLIFSYLDFVEIPHVIPLLFFHAPTTCKMSFLR